MFSSLIQAWMSQEPGTLVVSHDVSKPLRRSESFLRVLMTPAATRIIGYSGRQAELPLRISKLEFCDSAAHAQIQVADVLAGAASDWLLVQSGRKPGSDFHSALGASGLVALLIGGMLPDSQFDHDAAPSAGAGERSLPDGTKEFLEEVGFFKDRGKLG
jgi:hypothetical protein